MRNIKVLDVESKMTMPTILVSTNLISMDAWMMPLNEGGKLSRYILLRKNNYVGAIGRKRTLEMPGSR